MRNALGLIENFFFSQKKNNITFGQFGRVPNNVFEAFERVPMMY